MTGIIKTEMDKITLKTGNRIIIVIAVILLCLAAVTQPADAKSRKQALPEWAKGRIIAHAGGGIEGTAYTNSAEALSNSISSGARCIEIDFCWTSDHKLVCGHKSTLFNIGVPTEAEFLQTKAAGRFTQMTAATALSMLAGKGDVYMIMDTQENDAAAVYAEIYRTLSDMGRADYMNMVIPQMYRKNQYEQFKNVYDFRYGIMTMYKYKPLTQKKLSRIASFCRKKKLVLTISANRYKKKNIQETLKRSGVVVAVHTINDRSLWKRLTKRGASVVYTDFITN